MPIAIALLLMAWQQIAAEGLRSMQEHRLANLFSGGQGGGALTILLCTGLFLAGSFAGHPSLMSALWAYAAAPVVTLPLAILAVGRVTRARLAVAAGAGQGETAGLGVQQFLAYSGSLLLIQMLVFVMTQADIWFAGTVLSASALARYGAARRLLTTLVIPLQLVNLTVAPKIGELFASGRRQVLEQMLRRSSAVAFAITLAGFLFLAVGGHGLLGLLFGRWYQDGQGVLIVLCLGQLVVAWCGSSGYALVMTGKQSDELSITVKATVLLLLATPLAAMYYGELGIAAAVSLCAAARCLDEWWAVRRRLGVACHPDFGVLGRPLAAGPGAVASLLHKLLGPHPARPDGEKG
jgi:O-antigen/teichoic acid export membrane protein